MFTASFLFAGGGGDTEGAQMAGYRNTWAIENNKYAAAVYRARFERDGIKRLIEADITTLSDLVVKSLQVPDVLIGGSPCQGFSNGGLRKGLTDPRSHLFYDYLRFVTILQPKFFVWENVKNVVTINNGRDFNKIITLFNEAGYSIIHSVKNANRYVPQNRNRVYVVGIHGGCVNQLPDIASVIATAPREFDYEKKTLANCLEHSSQITEKIGICIKHGKNDIREYFDLAPTIRSLATAENGKQAGTGNIKVRQYLKNDAGFLERPTKPTEVEKIMGWTVDSTAKGETLAGAMIDISSTQRHKMLGNGIVPHEIAEILLSIKPALEKLKND
jgi:DNA-cytosine methyltransferase